MLLYINRCSENCLTKLYSNIHGTYLIKNTFDTNTWKNLYNNIIKVGVSISFSLSIRKDPSAIFSTYIVLGMFFKTIRTLVFKKPWAQGFDSSTMKYL